jgi:hypothetical protein
VRLNFLYKVSVVDFPDGPTKIIEPGRVLNAAYWFANRNWTDLRSIGNSNASKLTVLFPIVGYLIIFNDDLVQHLNLWTPIFGGEASPPYRLLCVYFGLIWVSAAAAIYGMRCPAEIKRHSTAVDYIAEMEGYASTNRRNAVEQLLMANQIAAPILHEFASERRDAVARLRATVHGPAQEEALATDYWRDVYRLHFNTVNASRARWRRTAWGCYLIGFILLGVPSSHVLWRVLVYTWKVIAKLA